MIRKVTKHDECYHQNEAMTKKINSGESDPPWRKVLWRKNNSAFFPDNYVSDSFFANLRVNQCLNQYSWQGMYTVVCHLLQYLFTVIWFGLTWWDLYTDDSNRSKDDGDDVIDADGRGILGVIWNSGRLLVPVIVVPFARKDPTLSELLRPRS